MTFQAIFVLIDLGVTVISLNPLVLISPPSLKFQSLLSYLKTSLLPQFERRLPGYLIAVLSVLAR